VLRVGKFVGIEVGLLVGPFVEINEIKVGAFVGVSEGGLDGSEVGSFVGKLVG